MNKLAKHSVLQIDEDGVCFCCCFGTNLYLICFWNVNHRNSLTEYSRKKKKKRVKGVGPASSITVRNRSNKLSSLIIWIDMWPFNSNVKWVMWISVKHESGRMFQGAVVCGYSDLGLVTCTNCNRLPPT